MVDFMSSCSTEAESEEITNLEKREPKFDVLISPESKIKSNKSFNKSWPIYFLVLVSLTCMTLKLASLAFKHTLQFIDAITSFGFQ